MDNLRHALTSLAYAACVLAMGASVLWAFRSRLRTPGWVFAFLFAAALCAGIWAWRLAVRDGVHDSLDPWSFALTLWILFDGVVDIRGSTKSGTTEFAFPRRWARELTLTGAIVGGMGAMIVVLSLVLGIVSDGARSLIGVAVGAMISVWGFITMKYGGKAELRTCGIQFGSQFKPWTAFRGFEWYEEGGESILRVRGRGKDVRIRWPEDPAVESVLSKHGLSRT